MGSTQMLGSMEAAFRQIALRWHGGQHKQRTTGQAPPRWLWSTRKVPVAHPVCRLPAAASPAERSYVVFHVKCYHALYTMLLSFSRCTCACWKREAHAGACRLLGLPPTQQAGTREASAREPQRFCL